jgi:transketolase-like protein
MRPADQAASLAGHLRLSNLCWIYDSNREDHTDIAFTEDVAARFLAYGWNVGRVTNPNDLDLVERATGPLSSQYLASKPLPADLCERWASDCSDGIAIRRPISYFKSTVEVLHQLDLVSMWNTALSPHPDRVGRCPEFEGRLGELFEG